MQHDFTRRGNIVALPCENNRFLLNIESFQDDGNHQYIDVGQCYDEHPVGTYSLYFGNLERFGSDNARTLIHKLIQLIHEDGSAFGSLQNRHALRPVELNLYNNI